MREYNFKEIEKKWQEKWEKDNIFKTENNVNGKENYYVLSMLPYPSGKLHVGHARNYTIGDVISRYKKMKGFNVLQPMGWDSFGLPAENAAIQHGTHPAIWTKSNIENMKRQLKLMGFSYDWEREIASYLPEYYKWNQWFFKRMYEKGLVYKKKSLVNWCPDCQTVLANEQVEDGKCWRHSKTDVIQKELEQWFFKITDYADELLEGHEEIKDGWPEKVLTMQKNWIGKSFGTELSFRVLETNEQLPVFTTRVDTIYGASYLVVAPEHPIVEKILAKNPALKEVVQNMKNTDLIERSAEGREKNGIDTGWKVENPISKELIPLWIADYVLMNYGTGAVMGVPAHDERDNAFAKKYNLPIIPVIEAPEGEDPFGYNGKMINSELINGLSPKEAIEKMGNLVEEMGIGKRTTKFRLKDWGISRQRYWGTPIPALHCEKCGTVLEKDENLPVLLPNDIEFTGNGNPLETSEKFKNATCPCCGGPAKRDTDTMDTFVDSSWYFLRYCDPKNTEQAFDKNIVDRWTPIHQYIGGVEHAVMHLLYARFFHKVLRDLGMTSSNEPFKRLLTQGMVLGPSYYSEKENKYLNPNEVELKGDKAFSKSGEELAIKVEKMSKSKNNGVDPEEIIQKYGVDSARVFIMFAAPPEKELEWNENGLAGAYRFLTRVWRLVLENSDKINDSDIDFSKISKEDKALIIKLNQTIKKTTDAIEANYHFNTAIAACMELINEVQAYINVPFTSEESAKILGYVLKKIILMLSPFAPHFCDELWELLGETSYLFNEAWPSYDERFLSADDVTIAVQVNGKMRGNFDIAKDSPKDIVEKTALELTNVKKHLENMAIVKIIVVPNKIVNIVVKPL